MRTQAANAASWRRFERASKSISSTWASAPGNGKTCMSGADFLDTNVLVYAYQFNDREKQRVAQNLIEAAVAGKFVISVQVLSEFASTLLHKASPLATPDAVTAILDKISAIKLVVSDGELVEGQR